MEYKSYLILIPPAMVGLFFIISSLGIELVHYKSDKICKLRYTFIDNIYSAAGTEIETRSQLIEPVEILQISARLLSCEKYRAQKDRGCGFCRRICNKRRDRPDFAPSL